MQLANSPNKSAIMHISDVSINKLKSILRSVTTFDTLNDGNLMHTKKTITYTSHVIFLHI
jgi:hypothetical protein